MIPRDVVEAAVRRAIAHHHETLPSVVAAAMAASGYAAAPRIGLAIGKAALAMARALGPVERGLCISPHDDGAPVPPGWRLFVSSHPVVDERAIVAGDAAIELVEGAPPDRVIVALISGGASALVEAPLVPIAELARITSALMGFGAPIAELNAVRIELSAIKGGKLAARARAPIVTLAISDVIGDDLATIGSGPTVLTLAREADAHRKRQRSLALRVMKRYRLRIPSGFGAPVGLSEGRERRDVARVIVPMSRLAHDVQKELAEDVGPVTLISQPITSDVLDAASLLSRITAPAVGWGEPVLAVRPDHGEGGRMQHLALALAKWIAGTPKSLLAIGSDGMDGPPPAARPAPAGAYVDGTTWNAIRAAGIDPQAALDRCDSGTALDAVGALVITGPTGVNHADLVVVG